MILKLLITLLLFFHITAHSMSLKESADQLSQVLSTLGVEAYHQKREQITEQLITQHGAQTWRYLSQIEKQSLVTYLNLVSERLLKLPKSHIGHRLAEQYFLSQKDNHLGLDWISDFYYTSYGRGVFHRSTREIHLQVLPPDEMIIVLVHELTHFIDPLIPIIEKDMSKQGSDARSDLALPIKNLSSEQRLRVGRYYFLRETYEKYYKEFLPRVNACLVFVDLYQSRLLNQPGHFDLARYQSVLNHQQTCESLTKQELLQENGHAKHYWRDGSKEIQMEQEYLRHWARKNGIENPYY